MNVNKDKDILTFSTGKSLPFSFLIIGIDPYGNVYDGYDGKIFDVDWESESQSLSPRERIELSEFIIKQWLKFKNKALLEI